MNNYTIVFAFLFSICSIGNAQKIEFGVQYNLSFSGPNSIIGIQDQLIYLNEQSVSTIRGSLGAGNAFEFSSKRILSEQVALGLNYRFFKSFELITANIITKNTHFKSSIQAVQQTIEPSLTFKIPFEKLTVTMSSGLLIPVKTKSQQLSVFEDSSSNAKQIEHFTYDFSIGYTGSLGFEIKVMKGLFFNASLKTNLMNLTLKEKTATSIFKNDIEISNEFPKYEKETIFHEDINNFSNNSSINDEIDLNKPKDELTKSQSFNTIGFSLGLTYRFNKKIKK